MGIHPLSTLILLVLAGTVSFEQPNQVPAYETRGRQTEVLQRAFYARLERFYEALSERLKISAPDLLPKLTPPPLAVPGYQVLPRVVPDAKPPSPPPKPQIVSYSWQWSETLIERETASLERLEADLAHAAKSTAKRLVDEKLVDDFRQIIASRRLIDSDIHYNWLWQGEIHRNRGAYDRSTKLQQKILERQAIDAALGTRDDAPVNSLPYLRLERPTPYQLVVTLPIYTDIADAAFLDSFRNGVEAMWHVRDRNEELSVRLAIEVLSPESLYGEGKPPAKGDGIDLKAHISRFPTDGAVLTTGAATTHVTAWRAMVLGPHDATPRLFAHELGHLLGIPDAYVRGYEDLGVDGYRVTELVVDPLDIMGSSGAGSVVARHFVRLIDARDVRATMEAGLEALYQRNDPQEAATRFREVLQKNPTHYGATLQLAKALDRSGQTDEAIALWKKMLEMAEEVRDTETIGTARTRLAKPGSSQSPEPPSEFR